MRYLVAFAVSTMLLAGVPAQAAYGDKTAASAKDQTMAQALADRYGTTKETVMGIRQNLKSWDDAITALLIAQKSGQNPSDVANLKKQSNQDWDAIAERFGLDKSALKKEVKMVRKEIKTGRAPAGMSSLGSGLTN